MICLQQVTLRRLQKTLLDDVDLTIFAKQKIGLIGDNGCGKSSFFAMLQHELEPQQGQLSIPSHLEIAHVRQETPASTACALEYVIDGDRPYRNLEKKLKEAEEENNATIIAKCHDELAHIGGYSIEAKAQKILKGLGFHSEQVKNPTVSFSGGWRMRLNLAQALMSRSDLMLLDEPTNHLDLDAIIWLEKWLQDYPGTLLIISHDREFLDNTVANILHFEEGKLQLYRGNYSSFDNQYQQQLAVQQAAYEKQQAHAAHLQSFIDRFKAKASKARQAQSRVKALEKISWVSAVKIRATYSFEFKKPKTCPYPLLRIENATLGYAKHTVLSKINLQIAPMDRIGLLGVNGAGKSTLIKAIAGQLNPLSGTIQLQPDLNIGYFAQHKIEDLDLSLSPLEMLQKIAPNHSAQALRTFLGSFNFKKHMATDKINHFSGGEKARLALALIIWKEPNLLLLDEPTNHLDMSMREALIIALQEYTGALILVSHDRHLIRTTTDELILIAEQKAERFNGDLEDYKAFFFQKNQSNTAMKKQDKINANKEKRQLENKLKSLEKQLELLQEEKTKIESQLADNTSPLSMDQLNPRLKAQGELVKKIQLTEADWLLTYEKLENL